ncbi:MAG TPA: hypothetical protein VGR57_08135 [Ktedonobacterales bacterium]|nr:hypothetical protein [Ktedonobacterales bacterium]
MNMLEAVLLWMALFALWAAGGALVGALGRLVAPDARGWWAPPLAGMAGALVGGVLGALLVGRPFGGAAALCGAALAVALRLALGRRARRAL